jgi:hypothetical protein
VLEDVSESSPRSQPDHLCLRVRFPDMLIGEHPFEPLRPSFFRTPQNLGLDLGPGDRAVLEVILQNARGQGWTDRAFLSFHSAHDFSTADDFRF